MENQFNNNQPGGAPNVTNTGYVNPTQQSNGMHPKRNNKKLIAIIAVIASVIVVAAVVVCIVAFSGRSTPTRDTEVQTSQVSTEGKSSNVDIPKVMADGITVKGKKVSFPCKVKDFGENWRIIDGGNEVIKTKEQVKDAPFNWKLPHGPFGRITDGKDYIGVYFCEYSDNGYDDIQICGIAGKADCVDVYGLSKSENAVADTKKLFGEPSEVSSYKGVSVYSYYKDNDTSSIEHIDIYISDASNRFTESYIVYYPEEYRFKRDAKVKTDLDKLFNDIVINGKNISFPCTIGELGEALGSDWEYNKNNLKYENGEYVFTYDNNKFFEDTSIRVTCKIKNYNKNIDIKDNKIYELRMPVDFLKGFRIGGITQQSTLSDFTDQYGDFGGEQTFYYLYDTKSSLDKKYVRFLFYTSGYPTLWSITLYDIGE